MADPGSVVRAFNLASWDATITPANLPTMREVPSEPQGDLLSTMRDVLKYLNGALDGPRAGPKSNSSAGMSFGCCFPFCSYVHRRVEDDEAKGSLRAA